jgi:hypothetical protein
MLKVGKLSREKLDMVKRMEAAHATALEDFPLFVGSLVRFLGLSYLLHAQPDLAPFKP